LIYELFWGVFANISRVRAIRSANKQGPARLRRPVKELAERYEMLLPPIRRHVGELGAGTAIWKGWASHGNETRL
jgi:hypothetical protein